MSSLDFLAMHQTFDGLPPSVIASIVDTFEDDLARLVLELNQAYRAGDPEGFCIAAHNLAGIAATFGAKQLEAMARRNLHLTSVSDASRLEAITGVALAARQEMRQAFTAQAYKGPERRARLSTGD